MKRRSVGRALACCGIGLGLVIGCGRSSGNHPLDADGGAKAGVGGPPAPGTAGPASRALVVARAALRVRGAPALPVVAPAALAEREVVAPERAELPLPGQVPGLV